MYAAKGGNSHIKQLLLNEGAAVNTWSSKGMTALMCVCQYGQTAAVQFLLCYDADPNIVDHKVFSPYDCFC